MSDLQKPKIEINVSPTQGQQLASSHARGQGQNEQCLETVAPHFFQKPTRFRSVPGRDLVASNSGRLHQRGNISRHITPTNSVFQCSMNNAV
jgi:hypothetical protein